MEDNNDLNLIIDMLSMLILREIDKRETEPKKGA